MQHTRRKLLVTWSGRGTWNVNVACFVVVLCFTITMCQNTCSSGPCYPAPSDIAGQFNVTANSTCGDPEEPFCVNLNCSYVCKANSPRLAHPSSFVTDNKDATFWKSVNFDYPVVLQLDIGRTFMLYQSIVTFYHELPAAMYLLKSNDSGRTYSPISYFATDCLRFFNLSETPENEVEGLKVQCFKIDRATNPSKQLYYSPMQDVNTAQNLLTDTQKQAFFLMTNLRIVLVEFITPSVFDPATLPESLRQSYFFSVLDWDVLASCHCNGQASKCDPSDHSKCVCERNTEGVNCERCLRLFNNKPYQVREPCEDCGCNNHSESCTYNKTKGYGVCDDCLHNTMGDKCNQCKPSYYRNPDVLFSHANACLACACYGPGVNSSADSSQCNNETGQCACKIQVTGRVCDRCHDNFWNLSIVNEQGCEGCGCNTTGTVNASNVCNKETGQCPCKPLLTGRTCNKCQDGYYGLTAQDPECSVCNCNPVGSANQTCNSTGHCFCRPRFFGDKCKNIEQGFFVPSVDYMTYEAEDAALSPPQEMRINRTIVTNADGASILVVGVVLAEGESSVSPTKLSFIINLPKTASFSFILRYKTLYQWELIKITVLLRSPAFAPFSCKDSQWVTRNEPHILIANVSSSRDALNFGSRCLLGGQYTVDLEIPFGSAVSTVMSQRRRRAVSEKHIVVDSIVVMPTLTESIAFQEASPLTQENMTFYYNKSFSLHTWTANLEEASAALSPVFGELFGEGQACNCTLVGSNNPQECAPNGGQCKCKSHVIGRTCEQCSLDYFNFTSGQGCQACNCSVIGSKQMSCHPDSGQCSCMNDVTGLHCDRCRRYYYNFNSGMGCSPCNCHPTYSSDLQCEGSTGMCSCKPGINGGKCTACQNQFYNLSDTGCVSCDCDPAGSLSLTCNKTTGQCPCKAQTLGPVCAECSVGYYGLSMRHPAGCLRCQCSNKSSTCVSDTGWFISKVTTTLSTEDNNVDKDGWSAVDGGGLTVQSLWDFNIMAVPFEKGSIKVDTSTSEEIYFNAPAKYLGDQRFAYTHSLSFKLQQDNASSPINSSKGDVILTGRWFNQPLVTALKSPPSEYFKDYTVNLFENYWRVGTTSGRQATSSELIVVLSDLTSLHIRATWTSLHSQLYSRIGDISLTISNRTSILPQLENASNVEDCSCPDEYEGQFCQQCAVGFTRVIPNGGPYVACLTCMCNGHSDTCDPETGVCHDCQHNTAGDHCEKCADGWYGNATNGTSQDCYPCPCPGGPSAPNQFATTCKLDSDGLPTCVNCTEGHQGRHCGFCMDGYFGQPMEQNGECLLCSCNDNIDLGASGNCNSTSGECLKCLYNTSGLNCEWCAPGFYGSALNKTCKGCTCSDVGAISNICHNISGTCDCEPHVTGMFCDKCELNAYNFTRSGCMLCNCDVGGSTDLQCDLMLGNCSCHPNVVGTKCNMCSKGFFDVTQRCQDCDCTVNQTVANTTCNAVTGQCECSVSLTGGRFGGRQCETCAVHTVGSPPSCYPCTEQCFLNWFNIVANESAKIDLLSEEVTKMLESFGSMSVAHVNHTLQDLYSNVSYAKQIFQSGGREDLERTQNQINQVHKLISKLQQQLNDSKDLIGDAQEYLADHVMNFNGSVQITPATPLMYPSLPIVCRSGEGLSIIVDWQCIEAMALTYRQRAFQANASAHAKYTSIQNSYEMIELANVTAFLAARQVNESLEKLQQVSNISEEVRSYLGDNFQTLYLNHSMRLAKTRRLMQTLEELLSQSKTLGEQATAIVGDAEETSFQAKNLAIQRKREAQSALDNATNAQSDALQAHDLAENALRLATGFKENATKVLNQTQEALRNVTTGINTVGIVHNMTQESTSISDEVKGMSMPVSLKEIQKLADDILNTDVSEEQVNQTLEKAEKSLQQARDVERLSQTAVNVSRQTLYSVEEIEKTMVMAEKYRREALDLQQQTDGMIGNITNITQRFEQRFSVAYSASQSLLTEINSTLVDLEEGLMCFDTAKNEAQNASNTARMAFNISKKAKEMFENSSASLPPAAALVNSSYEEANSSLAEVERTHQDSLQLLKNVTEAEVLLQQYINQRAELEKLGQEITQLDREADELLSKFSEAAERYGQCAGAS